MYYKGNTTFHTGTIKFCLICAGLNLNVTGEARNIIIRFIPRNRKEEIVLCWSTTKNDIPRRRRVQYSNSIVALWPLAVSSESKEGLTTVRPTSL